MLVRNIYQGSLLEQMPKFYCPVSDLQTEDYMENP